MTGLNQIKSAGVFPWATIIVVLVIACFSIVNPDVLMGQGSDTPAASTDATETPSAEGEEGNKDEGGTPWWVTTLLLILPVAVYYGGIQIAKSVRMPDYGWKIGLVLATIVAGIGITFNCFMYQGGPKKGVDLSGGMILVYEVDEKLSRDEKMTSGGEAADIKTSDLVQDLSRRLNPSGTNEIVIRPYGNKQVEIIIPNADAAEVAYVKQLITKSGSLQFLIVANREEHKNIQERATDPDSNLVYETDDEKTVIGRWVGVERTKSKDGKSIGDYRVALQNATLRDGVTGERFTFTTAESTKINEATRDKAEAAYTSVIRDKGVKELQILMAVDPEPELNVQGSDISSSSLGRDANGADCINFRMNAQGSTRMRLLTSSNLPNNTVYSLLGIVMDGKLLSAPRINDTITSNGQISGQFEREEVEFLVNILKAGKLSAVIRKDPISENQISSTLGQDTIDKGRFAILLSLAGVLIFMLFYYRFSGVLACLALMINLLLILAMMILVKAAFTLPGLAGLVLTVGMSVDANVLIFERIREELDRGAALRMAIRNGFGRATTTIVDANLTTLITALILYGIGTDQVRGFAVTLILGILMSMYTAIFCSRICFDIAERRGMSKLNMVRVLGATSIDFISKRFIGAAVSTVLIVVGLIAVVGRGSDILDIDFTGGTSVQVEFDIENGADIQIGDVRERLDVLKKYVPQVTEVTTSNADAGKIFKIDTAITGEEKEFTNDAGTQPSGVQVLQDKVKEIFTKELKYYVVEISNSKEVAKDPASAASNDTTSIQSMPAPTQLAMAGNDTAVLAAAVVAVSQPVAEEGDDADDATTGDTPVDESKADEPAADGETADGETADGETADGETADGETADGETADGETADGETADGAETSTPKDDGVPTIAPVKSRVRTSVQLTFVDASVDSSTVENMVLREAVALGETPERLRLKLSADGWNGTSGDKFKVWTVEMSASKDRTDEIATELKKRIEETPVFHSSNKIGTKVAGKTTTLAGTALAFSLLGIVAYIWIRFQKVVFGLAAVVALVHDVLITLGAIAISGYLYQNSIFGLLQIDNFKISLPIVAAFLTIIGYSLNDTIVVFDRIREVRGKSPDMTAEMLNTSINQTLSRTLLTSVTTLIVVFVLFWLGGQAIHGFAFALVVGVLVGTYSSIFVASPVLLWMHKADAK